MRKRNGLKIALLDIVFLKRYGNELNVILHENNIDIIGLSETRLEKKLKIMNCLLRGRRSSAMIVILTAVGSQYMLRIVYLHLQSN